MSLFGEVPSLSLIVPSYNHGKYLTDLVNSIYGGQTSLGYFSEQTLLPKEIIIADDCSTDDTHKIVEELAAKDDRIKYVRTIANGGTPVACNSAIYQATGEVITRIDADDMRETPSFEYMMEVQMKNMHSIVYDDCILFVNGKRMPHQFKMADYDFNVLMNKNIIHAGIMFPKKAWIDCGGYRERFRNGRDDWSFNVALGIAGYCGIHVNRSGYLYRREQQNRSLTNSSSERQAQYYELMKREFRDIYSGRFPMGCCGNRSSNTSSSSGSARSQQLLVGAEGMTIVQYAGTNFGTEVYYGPVTGLAYEFSVKKNRKNVDNRDLHTEKNTGLLDIVDHGKYIFTLAQVAEKVIAPEVVQPSNVEAKLETFLEEKVVVAEVEGQTEIEAGVVSGLGAARIKRLKDNGIIYWEQFLATESDQLEIILNVSKEVVAEFKDALVED